ncbi:MAG: hypothetical protein P9L91_10495, partial [Candidatus Zophobacter franzmannii]|nr:hypothetical protein [Candidatus Zophobacter franzmannii]
MSKHFIIVFLFILTITFVYAGNEFQVVRSSSEGIELRFELPEYQIKETVDGYDKLIVENSTITIEPGKPQLPVFTGIIAVPENGSFDYAILSQKNEMLYNLNLIPY